MLPLSPLLHFLAHKLGLNPSEHLFAQLVWDSARLHTFRCVLVIPYQIHSGTHIEAFAQKRPLELYKTSTGMYQMLIGFIP